MSVNQYAEFKPSVWQRIAWWDRWPWRPKVVPPDQRQRGEQSYVVIVRENDAIVGWHPVDTAEVTTEIVLGRWTCLAGLVKPPRFEVEIDRAEWHGPAKEVSAG